MLHYQNRQGNPVTFETVSEIVAHAPEATADLSGNQRMPRIANPALKDFPDDLVYVYRSANLYGGQTAARNNTSLIIFADKRFTAKDEALAWLKNLGLVELIDSVTGTVILFMPEKSEGYTESDLQHSYVLINALFTQKATVEVDGVRYCPAESEYCGGYGKNYFFGIGAGATFMNNFVAGSRDELIGRVAGYFTYGGEMNECAAVTGYVPAYLVNACGAAVRKFCEADGCNAYSENDGAAKFYNQNLPLRQVRVAKDGDENPGKWMLRAYKEMFMFLQRTANVMTQYPEPAVANPFKGFVPAPPVSRFALSARNPIFDNKTVIGNLQITYVYDPDRFADLKITKENADPKNLHFMTEEEDYLDVWYEILPQNVLDNSAPEHSVPLLLANHGGGDDIIMFLDETGILLTAGQQQFGIVAGMHSGLTFVGNDIVGESMGRLVKYMLGKFPALDPERVYVTGYSMGGACTYSCLATHPELYAAAVPTAMPLLSVADGTAEKFMTLDIPVMLATSTYDFAAWDAEQNHINEGAQSMFTTYQGFNNLAVPKVFDFAKYPFVGQPYDSLSITTINGEWRNFEWMLPSKYDFPLMGLNVTEYLMHSLWPGYGDIYWDFFRHYRREAGTNQIVYTE